MSDTPARQAAARCCLCNAGDHLRPHVATRQCKHCNAIAHTECVLHVLRNVVPAPPCRATACCQHHFPDSTSVTSSSLAVPGKTFSVYFDMGAQYATYDRATVELDATCSDTIYATSYKSKTRGGGRLDSLPPYYPVSMCNGSPLARNLVPDGGMMGGWSPRADRLLTLADSVRVQTRERTGHVRVQLTARMSLQVWYRRQRQLHATVAHFLARVTPILDVLADMVFTYLDLTDVHHPQKHHDMFELSAIAFRNTPLRAELFGGSRERLFPILHID